MIDLALLLRSYEPPSRPQMRYLELGFGQGLSENIHAAAVPGSFFGTDFNPAHAANAKALARVSQADVQFFDDSFSELLANRALPDFDYIVLHGIWSWITDETRNSIIDIIRRNLKVGSAVYISYNTLPGWATAMPLRHMLALHADMAGNDAQGHASRIDAAIAFSRQLADANARYFLANPSTKDRLDKIGALNRNYVAHEYFNSEWEPMYFSMISDWLARGKLGFASPASPLDLIDHINLPANQRAILDGISHVALKESVRDYLLNTQFRRDIFTRGSPRISAYERSERLKRVRIALTVPLTADFDYAITTHAGRVSLKKEIYEPILEALADGKGEPKSIADLQHRSAIADMPFERVIEAITILVGSGSASPAQTDDDIAIARSRCHRLNAHLLERAHVRGDVSYLASPVTGEGLHVSRFEQMFLLARANGVEAPDDWARDVWNKLKGLGQSLIVQGKVLEGEEDNLAELTRQANRFADGRLGILRTLGVVD